MCLTIDSICCSHALGSRWLEEGGNALRLVPIADVLKRVKINITVEMVSDSFKQSLQNFTLTRQREPQNEIEMAM
jgi:hypothetical protein